MDIVNALVMSLGFDTTQLIAGQKEATAAISKTKDDALKYAKEAEAAGKRVGEALGRHLTKSFLELAALLTGGVAFKDFITDLGNADLAVARLANAIGIKTESLSAFENAFERAGLKASDADSAFSSLNDTIQKIAIHGTGSGALANLANAAARAGVKESTFAGITNPEEMAYRVARDLAAVKAKFGAGLATSLGSDLGLNFGATTFFEQGEDAVRAATAKSKELGVAGKASAEAWAKFIDTLVSLRQAAAEFARTLMTSLTPAITRILDRMRVWIERNQEWLDQKITAAIGWLADKINSIDWSAIIAGAEDFAAQVKTVVNALGGWKAVGEELLALWAIANITPVLVNMALLVAALAGGGVGSIVGGAIGLLTMAGLYLLGNEFLGKIRGYVDASMGLSPEGMEYGPQMPGHVARQGAEGKRGAEGKGGGGGADRGGVGSGLTDKNRAQALAVMDRLIAKGWTKEAAASAVGQILTEDPSFALASAGGGGDSGSAHGLFQWRAERYAELQRYNAAHGGDSWQNETDFFAKENEDRGTGAWKNVRSIAEGNEYGYKYERYAGAIQARRAQDAQKMLDAHRKAIGPQSSLSDARHYTALGGAHVAATTHANQMATNAYDIDTTVGNVSVNTTGGEGSDSGSLARDNLRRVKRVSPANFGLA